MWPELRHDTFLLLGKLSRLASRSHDIDGEIGHNFAAPPSAKEWIIDAQRAIGDLRAAATMIQAQYR